MHKKLDSDKNFGRLDFAKSAMGRNAGLFRVRTFKFKK